MEPRYGHFNQLVEISMKMLEQKISLGEFEETINRIIATIRSGYAEINKIKLPPDLTPEAAKELERVKEGMALFEIGVQEMRKYIDTNEKQYLVEGLHVAQRASQMLNSVMELYGHDEEAAT